MAHTVLVVVCNPGQISNLWKKRGVDAPPAEPYSARTSQEWAEKKERQSCGAVPEPGESVISFGLSDGGKLFFREEGGRIVVSRIHLSVDTGDNDPAGEAERVVRALGFNDLSVLSSHTVGWD